MGIARSMQRALRLRHIRRCCSSSIADHQQAWPAVDFGALRLGSPPGQNSHIWPRQPPLNVASAESSA